jgi:hypothetical protein
MTDREILTAAAEKVMGWQLKQYGHNGDSDIACLSGRTVLVTDDDAACRFNREWNPLTSDADAFMLVDALGKKGIDLTLECCYCTSGKRESYAQFGCAPSRFEAFAPDRRRAITLAALRAVGVEVEGK